MRSLEARLRHIKTLTGKEAIKIFILRVGNSDDCQFSSEAEYHEGLKNPKYKDAIVIRDLDNWI